MIIAKKVSPVFDQISHIDLSDLKQIGKGCYKGHISFVIDGLEFWSEGEHHASDFESQGFIIVQEPEIKSMNFYLKNLSVSYINLDGYDDHVSIDVEGLSGERIAEIVEEETGLQLSYDQRQEIIERFPLDEDIFDF